MYYSWNDLDELEVLESHTMGYKNGKQVDNVYFVNLTTCQKTFAGK